MTIPSLQDLLREAATQSNTGALLRMAAKRIDELEAALFHEIAAYATEIRTDWNADAQALASAILASIRRCDDHSTPMTEEE